MGASQIPQNVAAALRKCRPDGVVEAFPTDESYFHEIRRALERDLSKMSGATLHWQTPQPESVPDWDDDWDHDPLPPDDDWQSYHAFFLAPNGKEFRFEDEIEGLEEAEDPESEEWIKTTFPGGGWIGCPGPVVTVGVGAFKSLNTVNDAGFVENLSSPFFGHAVAARPPRRVQFLMRFRF